MVLVVVASVALAVWVVTKPAGPAPSTRDYTPTAEPTPTEPEERALLVVGDSWTAGNDDVNAVEWPMRLDVPNYRVVVNATPGSGYLVVDRGLGVRDRGRLERLLDIYDPDLVLVALGRADISYPVGDVTAEARLALEEMQAGWPDAEIVVFSPFPPDSPRAETRVLTEALEGLADDLGLPFLDVSEVIDTSEIVGGYPTERGQRAIAAFVSDGLRDLGAIEDRAG